MRCALLATGYKESLLPFINRQPSPMFHVLDKPMIIQVLEFLHQEGITQVDIFLSHLPQTIEEYLKDGKRWGMQIKYHLCTDHQNPFKTLAAITPSWDEEFLLGTADALPRFSLPFLQKTHLNFQGNTSLCYPNQSWSGWGIFSITLFQSLPQDTTVNNFIKKIPERCQTLQVTPFLSLNSCEELQKTNLLCLSSKTPSYLFPVTSRMTEPGVWISRASSVHPTAKLIPPCFIGEFSQIKENAQIGPEAIIENHCVIDQGSHIANSLVMQNTYVGEGLEINQCVVDRHHLVNLNLNTHLVISEEFILSELKASYFRRFFYRLFEKIFVLPLILLFLPKYIYWALAGKLKVKEAVKIPSPQAKTMWKKFSYITENSKPLLINILKGNLHLVGLPPRSPEELRQLSPEWQAIYVQGKLGLITPEMVDYSHKPSLEEQFISEGFYLSQMSFWHDIKILGRWVRSKLLCISIL